MVIAEIALGFTGLNFVYNWYRNRRQDEKMITNERNDFINKSLELSTKKLCKLQAISTCYSKFPAEKGEWILVLTTVCSVPHYMFLDSNVFDNYTSYLESNTARVDKKKGILYMEVQRFTNDIKKKGHYNAQCSNSINTSCFCRKFDATLFKTDDGSNPFMAATANNKHVFFKTSDSILIIQHLLKDAESINDVHAKKMLNMLQETLNCKRNEDMFRPDGNFLIIDQLLAEAESINDDDDAKKLSNLVEELEKCIRNEGILRPDENFIIQERLKQLLDSHYPLWIYISSEDLSADFPEGYYNVQKVGDNYRFDQILLGDQFHLDGH